MPPIIPFDDHNFFLTFLVTVLLQLSCFLIAWTCQFDKITDLAGSINFILLALLTLFANTNGQIQSRAILVTSCLCIARLELALYLFYRVLKRGKDARFDTMRSQFVPFLIFWIFQIIWVWLVSLPVIFINSEVSSAPLPLFSDGRDIFGLILFLIGFITQVISDLQKDTFRANIANKEHVCDIGIWKYSRHPNFFGEIIMWWGIIIIASPQLDSSSSKWGWIVILSPLFTMFILLFGSGIPTAEGNNQLRFMKTIEAKAKYEAYRWKTSPLIPLPNFLYARIPLVIKRWFLFEFTMYEVSDDTQNSDIITASTSLVPNKS
jgi:steroid 5-alpha reductase family enzyme